MQKRGIVNSQLITVVLVLIVAYFFSSFSNEITGQQVNIGGDRQVCFDIDGDNFNGGLRGVVAGCGVLDCNDNDPTIYPGAIEVCDDGLDQDCDRAIDCVDSDCTGNPLCDDDDEDDPTLIAYWPYDEGSGSITLDATDNGHDGILRNGVSWESVGCPSSFEPCLSFDGSDDYVEISTFDLPVTDALTFAAWIKPRDFNPSDARIASESTGTGEQDHCFMASFSDTDHKFRTRIKTVNTVTHKGGLLTKDAWQHVAVVYDGSAETVQHYVDGIAVNMVQGGSQSGVLTQCPGVDLWHARNPDGYGAGNLLMDEVRIYDRALSESEINELADKCSDVVNAVCHDGCLTPPEVCDSDSDCAQGFVCNTCQSCDPPAECQDGIDNNDQDGWIDYPTDPGCSDPSDDDETNVGGPACSDEIDNDNDGLMDGYDPMCLTTTDVTETAACQDGIDNDQDGLIDYTEDPGCSGNPNDNNEIDAPDFGEGDLSCEDQAVLTGGIVYYLEHGGSTGNDGLSTNNPWPNFGDLVKANYLTNGAVQSGDVLCLLPGQHWRSDNEKTVITDTFFDINNRLVVMGQLDTTDDVQLKFIDLRNTRGIVFQQFSMSSTFPGGVYTGGWGTFIRTDWKDNLPVEHITIQRMKFFVVKREESDTWDQSTWDLLGNEPESTAILLPSGSANYITIVGNDISTVAQGITASGSNHYIAGNIIDRWNKDAITGISGENVIVENNLLVNSISLTGAHHDAIQLHAGINKEKVAKNIVIRNNQAYQQQSDYSGCCIAPTQGINNFDIYCENCIVENNIVNVGHNHGMTWVKPSNSRFVGNTVYGCLESLGKNTPLSVGGSGNTIENNIAGNTDYGSNMKVLACDDEGDQHFVDWRNQDFRLKATSSAVNTGNNQYTNIDDFEGEIRPCQGTVDVGADELCP